MKRILWLLYDTFVNNHIMNFVIIVVTTLSFSYLFTTLDKTSDYIRIYNDYHEITQDKDSIVLSYSGTPDVLRYLYYVPEDDFYRLGDQSDCKVGKFKVGTVLKSSSTEYTLSYEDFLGPYISDLDGSLPLNNNEIVLDSRYKSSFKIGDSINTSYLSRTMQIYNVSLKIVGFCDGDAFGRLYGLSSNEFCGYTSKSIKAEDGAEIGNDTDILFVGVDALILPFGTSSEMIDEVKASVLCPISLKTAEDHLNDYIKENFDSLFISINFSVFTLSLLSVLFIGRNMIMVYKNKKKLAVFHVMGVSCNDILLSHVIYELLLFIISVVVGACFYEDIAIITPETPPSLLAFVISISLLTVIFLLSSVPYLIKLKEDYILEDL